LDLARLGRDQRRLAAGPFDRVPRLGQLDLLDPVRGDERYALAAQVVGHGWNLLRSGSPEPVPTPGRR
jgi:hypothetical protein